MRNRKRKFNVVDLFCGCGGLSLGFQKAGFKIKAGVDSDSEAIDTFKENFPEADAVLGDLGNPCNSLLKRINKADVFLGGPPCQGFSIAGKRDSKDPRNNLIKSYLKILSIIKPRVVLIENVPNILGMANGKFKTSIISGLIKSGYHVAIEKLNACNFGVPQNRNRVFFIGTRGFELWPTELDAQPEKLITTKEAIDDLPTLSKSLGSEIQAYRTQSKCDYQRLMRKSSDKVLNHISVDHTERTKKIIGMVPDGGNYKDLPKEFRDTRRVNIAWTRMNSKKPCFTIDAGHNHHFHYKQNRVPTVRECARIQSFPDDFVFLGKRTSQYRQVGNAVPPLLAQHIASVLLNKLVS